MPALIDYGVRFEIVREAVFHTALRDGRITLPGVATECGISQATLRRLVARPSALPTLGLQLVARRRRVRRLSHVLYPTRDAWREWPREQRALALELPLDDERAAEAQVWRVLGAVDESDAAVEMRNERETTLDSLVLAVVEGIPLVDPVLGTEQLRLRALVAGLTETVCAEWASPEHAADVLELHLRDLAARGLQGVA